MQCCIASYYNRDGLLAGERDFTRVSVSDGSLIDEPGTLFPGGSSLIEGTRFNAGFGNSKFEEDGSITPYNAATDAYNFAPTNYLQVPQERYLIYGASHFEVNDYFKPYVEGQFINNRVDSQLAPTPIGNTTPGVTDRGGLQMHVYSPFLAPTAQAQLQAQDTDRTTATSRSAAGAAVWPKSVRASTRTTALLTACWRAPRATSRATGTTTAILPCTARTQQLAGPAGQPRDLALPRGHADGVPQSGYRRRAGDAIQHRRPAEWWRGRTRLRGLGCA